MTSVYNATAAEIAAFTKAYILSLDPELQASWNKRINNNPSLPYETMFLEMMAIAQKGRILLNFDVDCMGACPLLWMITMENQGYHSMWNALQPAGNVSAYADPNPKNWPAGAVRVSSNINDWPPFLPVPPSPTPFDPSLVGVDMCFSEPVDGVNYEVFSARAQAHFNEGYMNGAYMYHLMGHELMNPNQRTGVWLLPIKGGVV
jgi:hypothetical protein